MLRGIAALLITLVHLGWLYPNSPDHAAAFGQFPSRGGEIHTPWLSWFDFEIWAQFRLGYVAVALFFLVSGFVIPFSLRETTLRGFTARRFFRIYPTLWACLAITLAVLFVQRWISGSPVPFSFGDVVKNGALLAPYLGVFWIDPVLWTLAIEELFYVCAGVLAWRSRLDDGVSLVVVAVGCAAIAFVPNSLDGTPWLYWLAFNVAFLPLVFVGTVAYEVWRNQWSLRRGVTVGAVLYGLFTVSILANPNGPLAVPYLTSSVLAIGLFALLAANAERVKYSPWLDRLGSISYPLYLLHQVNGYVLMRWLEAHGVSYYIGLPIAIAAAVGGALLVHQLVELPMMRIGKRIAGAGKSANANANATA